MDFRQETGGHTEARAGGLSAVLQQQGSDVDSDGGNNCEETAPRFNEIEGKDSPSSFVDRGTLSNKNPNEFIFIKPPN